MKGEAIRSEPETGDAATVGDMHSFSLTRLEKVLSGTGCTRELAGELSARGIERVLISTTRSLSPSRTLDLLIERLAPLNVSVCAASRQHAPHEAVRELTDTLIKDKVQAVISLGGGSAIDATKVAVASLLNGRDMTREGGELQLGAAFDQASDSTFLHIAVPTTLSAGAFTPAGGTTDSEKGVKHAIVDPRLQPAIVVHDPEMTEDTPRWLWVATGIRALDHAIEAIYSRRHHPVSDALAKEAIRLLAYHLPRSVAEQPNRAADRLACLDAAWMSLFGGFNTGLGVSHALGHQIGPAWNIPHGVTSCVTLPHAMRFVAELAPQRFAPIAEALRLPPDGDAKALALRCADAVASLISDLEMPVSLQEVGVPAEELARIAEATRSELESFDATDRPVSVDEVMDMLSAAYPAPGASKYSHQN